MALGHVEVPCIRIADRLVGLEEKTVPAFTVMGIPRIPDPLIVKSENQLT
jgi:hypothetical protein